MKLIKNTSEILEQNIKYTTDGVKYFEIEYDKIAGFTISGHVCGPLPNYVCTDGGYVRRWKTFAVVVRSIRIMTLRHEWGFGVNFIFENIIS